MRIKATKTNNEEMIMLIKNIIFYLGNVMMLWIIKPCWRHLKN